MCCLFFVLILLTMATDCDLIAEKKTLDKEYNDDIFLTYCKKDYCYDKNICMDHCISECAIHFIDGKISFDFINKVDKDALLSLGFASVRFDVGKKTIPAGSIFIKKVNSNDITYIIVPA